MEYYGIMHGIYGIIWLIINRYGVWLLISGLWYTYPSEKYEFVTWDDEIPNIRKSKTCSFYQLNMVSYG